MLNKLKAKKFAYLKQKLWFQPVLGTETEV